MGRDTFEPEESGRLPIENELAWLLAQGIRAMHLAGEEGLREYAHVIRLLRTQPDGAADAGERWLALAQEDTMLRWSVLHVLAEIEDPRCLSAFRREALRRVPARVEGACEQRSDNEELVVVMAIEGLARLAQAGDEQALNALMEVVEGQDRTCLRQPAAAAAIAAREDFRGRVVELLPEDERYVLDLRAANEEDLLVELAGEARDNNPNWRETGPKPSFATAVDAPVVRCRAEE
jgi:hypothetical protein